MGISDLLDHVDDHFAAPWSRNRLLSSRRANKLAAAIHCAVNKAQPLASTKGLQADSSCRVIQISLSNCSPLDKTSYTKYSYLPNREFAIVRRCSQWIDVKVGGRCKKSECGDPAIRHGGARSRKRGVEIHRPTADRSLSLLTIKQNDEKAG